MMSHFHDTVIAGVMSYLAAKMTPSFKRNIFKILLK